ncbi:MAG: class IIb bacteriocin, lactobin A/cerein 7B family [Gammaproteobacteria bacterium]|nr:class IIb bacteriocin, lactobin A/cerein 7B family [Gammaproteobacteria bacterium]
MRELTDREVAEVSGGVAPLVPIGLGAGLGALGMGFNYSLENALSGSFTWTGFTGSVLQGAITGALMGGGGVLFAVPGGVVAGVSANGLAAVITATDPAQSLQ